MKNVTKNISLICSTAAFTFLVFGFFPGDASPKDTLQADQLFSQAASLTERKQYDSAVYVYDKAAEQYRRNRQWEGYVKSLNKASYILFTQSRFERQKQYLQMSLDTAKKYLGEVHPEVAFAYNDLGMYYMEKRDYNKCMELLKKAFEIREKVIPKNYRDIAESYHNISSLYGMCGNIDRQIEYAEKALKIIKERFGENDEALVVIYRNTGRAYEFLGDRDRALQYYRKSLDLNQSLYGNSSGGRMMEDIYRCLQRNGQYEEALQIATGSLELYKKTVGEKHYRTAVTYRGVGIIYQRLSLHMLARKHFLKSIEILSALSPVDTVTIADNYVYLSRTYLAEGDTATYYQLLRKGCDMFANSSVKVVAHVSTVPNAFIFYDEMAHYHYIKKEYDRALENVQIAMMSTVPNYTDKNVLSNPGLGDRVRYMSYLFAALKLKAKIFRAKYEQSDNISDLKQAFAADKRIIEFEDRLLSGYTRESVIDALENSLSARQEAVENATLLYQKTKDVAYLDQAFEIAEKSKSVFLRQIIADRRAKRFAGMPTGKLAEERDLQASVAYYESRLAEAEEKKDESETRKVRALLFQQQTKRDSLLKAFKEKAPDYFALKYRNEAISIKKVRDNLPDAHEALIEYFLSEKQLFIFLITKSSVRLEVQHIDSAFREKVLAFRSVMAEKSLTISPERFAASARDLYRLLLTPIEKNIRTEKIHSLKIIPDAFLGYIPFEVLLTKDPGADTKNFRDLPYVLRDYTIRYDWSALTFSSAERENRASSKLIAFAPSYEYKGAIASARNDAFRSNLEPLYFTKSEVEGIGKVFTSDSYVGQKADENTFKNLSDRYSIIHLATHAVTDDKNPLNSKLVFSPSTSDDGYLHAYELYGLNLNADLVVLSACNTGYGKLRSGEGIVSLARGFAYAGCPSLVMTLWQVNDRSTSKLITYFYEELSKGEKKSEALRKAKLRYLQSADELKSHPLYWAGLVLNGDDAPLRSESGIMRPILLAVGLGLILLIFIWIRRKRVSRS